MYKSLSILMLYYVNIKIVVFVKHKTFKDRP